MNKQPINGLSLIVAYDSNMGIGIKQSIPWRLPNDMRYFKEMTTGHIVIMGRKTFESLPNGPLPNRFNIILTSNKDYKVDATNAVVLHSVNAVLQYIATKLGKNGVEAFVMGGESIYREFLPYCENLYITKVHSDFECDTYFPKFDPTNWKQMSKTDVDANDKNAYAHSFIMYGRQQR